MTFLHEHLIAHRVRAVYCSSRAFAYIFYQDIADSNIVINIHGPRGRSWRSPPAFKPTYYFIDFELALKFDPTSDPKSRYVFGMPTERFGRVAAPEVQHTAPYKADMFALRFIYYDYFRVSCTVSQLQFNKFRVHWQCDKELPEVVEIFRSMLRADPSKRSSARHACLAMRLAISNIPPELLQKQMDKPFEPPERREEIVVALNEFAHDFIQVRNNNEESMALTTSSVGNEFVGAAVERKEITSWNPSRWWLVMHEALTWLRLHINYF